MLPSRPSGAHPGLPASRASGAGAHPQMSFDALKKRLVAKLEDRLDMSASKRMPQSLLRQNLRQQADLLAEQEGRGFSKTDRDRLVEEVLTELLGYGPLEELFGDPAVREVMVTGPGAVIVKREAGHWLPTSVKFRDEAHVRTVLDRIAAHADAVGAILATMATFDLKLPNGFRVIAVIPPEALGHPATAAFVRDRALPAGLAPAAGAALPAVSAPNAPASGSTSNGVLRTIPGTPTVSPRLPGSTLVPPPAPRPGGADTPAASGAHDQLTRHRTRITERLLAKLASLKVYDLSKFDAHELERIITAYVAEYAEQEKLYISDTDQGRLTLEILTSLRR